VYLEDLEPPSSSSQAAAADTNDETLSKVIAASADHGDSAKPKATSSTASISNGKRQRTLFDMLGSSSAPSQAPSKKPKLAAAAASGPRNKLSTLGTAQSSSGAGGSDGQQPLNSIPFSLSEYVASLTEDQKRLLKLECETMGKSW
jgi:uracil-DNA glycosylase